MATFWPEKLWPASFKGFPFFFERDGEDGGFIQAFTVNGKTVGFGGLSPETGKRTDASE